MIESLLRIAAIVIVLTCASGCGLKGELYIPEKETANPAQSESQVTPEPIGAAEEQNDDEAAGD